jgi:type IV pilus biogenesis protein CpaD/CtpE
VRRKLLLIAAAAGLASGCGSTDPAATRSACGDVDVPAAELGLERTRELTLCLLNQERAREGLAALRYDTRLEKR